MRRLMSGVPLVAAATLLLAACYDRGSITGPGGVQLPAPASLNSISLNGAVHLEWSDNAYTSDPNDFAYYQVYSTSYDLDHNLCGSSWVTEGTTVSPEFLVGALTNGVPGCFEVTAVSLDNIQSDPSPVRNDTPRPDGQNVLVFTSDTLGGTQSAFRFWIDASHNGLVYPAGTPAVDFVVEHASGGIFIVPQGSDSMQLYGNTPIADLTAIDLAPAAGYSDAMFEAVPQWGYVFQIRGGAFYQYGAIRVSAVGPNYVIFDWSYQTDPGNPELIQRKR